MLNLNLLEKVSEQEWKFQEMLQNIASGRQVNDRKGQKVSTKTVASAMMQSQLGFLSQFLLSIRNFD